MWQVTKEQLLISKWEEKCSDSLLDDKNIKCKNDELENINNSNCRSILLLMKLLTLKISGVKMKQEYFLDLLTVC